MSLYVFILAPDKQFDNSKLLDYFDDKYVSLIKFDKSTSQLTILKECLSQLPDDTSVLILAANSVTNLTKETLNNYLAEIKQNEKYYDIFYLTRWQDDCKKLLLDDRFSFQVARTYSARGFQAVYLTNYACKVLQAKQPMRNGKYFLPNVNDLDVSLINEYHRGAIIAYCSVYNLFNYDVSQIDNNLDFNKLTPCCSIIDKPEETNYIVLGYLWFALAIIIILVVIFIIARISK